MLINKHILCRPSYRCNKDAKCITKYIADIAVEIVKILKNIHLLIIHRVPEKK